jgi:hypothetical protein
MWTEMQETSDLPASDDGAGENARATQERSAGAQAGTPAMDLEVAVARAICLAAYDNTDEWREWLPEARAAIKAVESYRVPPPAACGEGVTHKADGGTIPQSALDYMAQQYPPLSGGRLLAEMTPEVAEALFAGLEDVRPGADNSEHTWHRRMAERYRRALEANAASVPVREFRKEGGG